jgi:hypothetical protein
MCSRGELFQLAVEAQRLFQKGRVPNVVVPRCFRSFALLHGQRDKTLIDRNRQDDPMDDESGWMHGYNATVITGNQPNNCVDIPGGGGSSANDDRQTRASGSFLSDRRAPNALGEAP